MTPARGTTTRSIRIEDDLWAAALAKADETGVTISSVVRDALQAWVKG